MKRTKSNKFFESIHTFSFWLIMFAGLIFWQGSFAATLSSTTTEFLPTFYDDASIQAQKDSKLLLIQQALQGTISNQTLYSLTGALPVKTTTNTDINSVVFTKNLKIGDTDPQVLLLQKALNEDIDTIIAETGDGSPGKETSYFGKKTKMAVIKLQNKHYGEVLAPNGLSVGTGIFGPSTRAMMNNMQKNKAKNSIQSLGGSVTSTIPKGPVSGLGEKVKIDSIEPTHGKGNTRVTIHGSGITKMANKIIAGGQKIYNATSSDGKTLTFMLEMPDFFEPIVGFSEASTTYLRERFGEYKMKNFPVLKYPICILNDSGMSNCAFFTVDF